jgi:hypothetical protein
MTMRQEAVRSSRATTLRSAKAAKRATCPLINQRIIATAGLGDVALLLREVEVLLPEMNLVNLSTALHRLARLAENDPEARAAVCRHPVFPGLLRAATSAFDQAQARGAGVKSQGLSNTVWALANLQVTDLSLLRHAAAMGCEHVAEFKPFELSAVLWSFVKLGVVGEDICEGSVRLFEAAASHISDHVEDFSFQCLLMIACSFATVKLASRSLFDQMATHMAPMVHTAKCKELANAAWAFGAVGARHDDLFSEIAARALQQLDDFKPEELSVLLHSFASLGLRHERLLEAGAVALRRMDSQTAHLALALSNLRPRHKSTLAALTALLPRCTQLLAAFKPEELSSVALAAGKCFGRKAGQQASPEVMEFFNAALPYVLTRLPDFSGQSLANIAAAFSDVGMGGRSGLFTAISREVVQRLETLEDSALLVLLRCLPGASHSTWVHGAVRMLFGEMSRRVDRLRERELWSLAKVCGNFVRLSSGDRPSREELRGCCQVFAVAGIWTGMHDNSQAAAPAPQGADWPKQSPSLHGQTPQQPLESLEVVQDLTASKEDLAATEVFRQCVETAATVRDEKTAQQPVAPSERLPPRGRVMLSVKNTFLDVVESSSEDSEGEGAVEQNRPLPPALDFITPEVSAEKLAAYRMNYQKFRIGMANGAKGEMADFVCE